MSSNCIVLGHALRFRRFFLELICNLVLLSFILLALHCAVFNGFFQVFHHLFGVRALALEVSMLLRLLHLTAPTSFTVNIAALLPIG